MLIGPAARVEPAVTGGAASQRSSARTRARELLGRERLGEIVVGAEREGADAVGLLAGRSGGSPPRPWSPPASRSSRQNVVAGDAGEHQVEDDDVGLLLRAALSASGPLAAVETRKPALAR